MPSLPRYTAARYVISLREGGSLPAVVETEEAGLFVVKFRGAGQGARALVAEVIVGGLAQRLGLRVPELATVDLDASFGRTEPDPEVQDILRGGHGTNVGLRFLDGAFPYDPLAAADLVEPEEAAAAVWLDALTTNVDRTARNPNLLVWDRRLWLIDHGAALYFHHDWDAVDEVRARAPFGPIRDHVLLPVAADLAAADARLAPLLTPGCVDDVLEAIPDDLLMAAPEGNVPPFPSPEAARAAHRRYFRARLAGPRPFAEEAARAQTARASETPTALPYRR